LEDAHSVVERMSSRTRNAKLSATWTGCSRGGLDVSDRHH
jgi:hypothetical protein